ncbi:S-layer homology domain-containing protein [Pseudoflavonifractor sp. DSM 107456]|uniref:S-layer homology domain-containing protein n=1 Tax=Pseudoflavonifractor gallinarum TaxID=2779352 RepID=A0ABR9R7Y2_9FIRM|nr:S-layer homology domain-containing protein [Pseudoflavonifractor gallinarum]MBE5054797.1 S-layer homology domain-containing protein [Pseudoflavonifractor gallinarum]
MNNLKRVLSVGMASTMVLGMMATASAASFNDFTDKDEIVNKDAVSMVTELGIIAGLPDGSYGATQNIDRASFARLICVTLNGGKEPTLGNLTTSFTDTKGHWAEKYIAYCVQQGIIAGKGNNTFAPSAQVTGSEAAKMLLVAVGYNTTYEGIGGATWQVSTDVLANQVGLYKGLETINTSAALTRDQAAQMIYNALNAEMVKYEIVPGVSTNGQIVANTQRQETGETLLEKAFKAVKVEGVVLANEYAALNGAGVQDEGKTYVQLNDAPKGLNSTGAFKVSTDLDMVGKTVTMFVQPDANSTQTSKAVVLGNALESDTNNVAVLTAGKDSATKIKEYLDDNNLKTNSSTEWYVNYAIRTTGSGDSTKNDPLTTNEAGKELTFIDNNDDGVVDYALQLVKTFGKVTSYNDSKDGTINVSAVNPADSITYKSLSSTKAAKDINGFADVKKDDYVFIYKIGNKEFVEPAKSVEVTVSSIKGNKVTADDTTYEQSGLVKGVNEDAKNLNEAVELGDKVTFYLDNAGYVVYTDAEAAADEYLKVLAVDSFSSVSGYANTKILKTDGTTEVVNAYYDNGTKKVAPTEGAIYAYSVNSKGVYKLVLTDLTEKNINSTTIEKGKTQIKSGVLANAQTVFVIDRGNDVYTVYTGIANVPKEITVKTGSAIVDKNNIAKAVFISDSDMTGSTEGVYVLDKNPTVTGTSDDKTYTYDVIYKGEKTTLTSEDGKLFASKGYYDNVSINGTEITKVTGSAIQPSEATVASKGLVANAQGTFSYSDSTKVLYVDGTDVSESSIGAITVKDGDIKGDNILVIKDSDNENIAAYVLICK